MLGLAMPIVSCLTPVLNATLCILVFYGWNTEMGQRRIVITNGLREAKSLQNAAMLCIILSWAPRELALSARYARASFTTPVCLSLPFGVLPSLIGLFGFRLDSTARSIHTK